MPVAFALLDMSSQHSLPGVGSGEEAVLLCVKVGKLLTKAAFSSSSFTWLASVERTTAQLYSDLGWLNLQCSQNLNQILKILG